MLDYPVAACVGRGGGGTVHLAVAGGVCGGDFCAVLFPTRCLGWDLGLDWVNF